MWLCVPSLSRDIANRLVADVEASAQLISKPVIGHAIYEPKGHFSGTLPSFLGLPSVSLSGRWITKILYVFLVFKPSNAIYEPKGHFSGTLSSFLGLPSVSLSARWITKILYVFLVLKHSNAIHEPKGHFSGTLPSILCLPSVGLSGRWITKIPYVFLVFTPNHISIAS